MQPFFSTLWGKGILKWIFRVLLFQLILINISAAFHAYKFTHFYSDKAVYNQPPSAGTFLLRTWRLMVGKRYGRSPIVYTPSVPYDTLSLSLSNGLKISGWYIRADTAIGTAILFHGLGSNKGQPLNEAAELRLLGYNTLLIDLRAHGASEGKAFSLGYKESEEVKLAYDYIKGKGESNILLWGMSVGAVIIAKAIDDYAISPSKIILEMPFSSLEDHLRSRARTLGFPEEPFAFFVTFWTGLEQGYWGYAHKTTTYVRKIKCPVLLQWGKQDEYVKESEIKAIFKNIGTSKKQLVVYDQSGHVPLCWSENDKWHDTVVQFLR
ncbi:MAG: hypothetical protein GC171_13250 [Terrimonas sp.]|nr:hypothetical protein [Terrimonas sp.]